MNNDKPTSKGLILPLSSLILSKEVPDKDEKNKGAGRNGVTQDMLHDVLKERTAKLDDAQGIMEIHPDLRLAREILIAQTLSPKDLSETTLRLKIDRSVFKGEVKPETLEKITTHFRTKFNLESKMGEILGEALFDKGAFAYLMVPPSEIDEKISELKGLSMESLVESTSTRRVSFLSSEGAKRLNELGISMVTPSLGITKEPHLNRLNRRDKQCGLSMESMGISSGAFKNAEGTERLFRFNRRKSTDLYKNNPICFKLPVDKILNIHEPSDPSVHTYHLILVDEHGNIVSDAKDSNFAGDLESRLKKALGEKEGREYEIVQGLGIEVPKKEKENVQYFLDAYTRSVEEPLRQALVDNDITDGGIKLDDYDAPYRLMLSRALMGMKTRILFVPSDFVSYLAFDYNSMGHGISLLEKTKFYSSLRAVLQIADMIGAVNNSVPQTELEITLDDADNDPMGTITTLMHELSDMTSQSFPIGTVNASDIVSSIHRAAYRLKIDGGDKFPKTKVERSDVSRSVVGSDADLMESITKKLFAGVGVPYEAIDQSLTGELATGLILNDLLAAKRAMERQKIFRKGMEDFMTTYIYLSGELYGYIKEGIKESDEEGFTVDDYIGAIRMVLPEADSSRIESQAEQFGEMSDFIRDAVELYLGDSSLRGILEDTTILSDQLEDMREIIASALIRDWMSENNILPQLSRIVTEDKELSLIDPITDHYTAVFKNWAPMVKSILKGAGKLDKEFVKATDKLQEEDEVEVEEAPEENLDDGRGEGGIAIPFNEDGTPDFGNDDGETDDVDVEPEEETANDEGDETVEPTGDDELEV